MRKIFTLGGIGFSGLAGIVSACGPGHDKASEVAGITGNAISNGFGMMGYGYMGYGGFLGGVIVALLIIIIVLLILNLTRNDKKGGRKNAN